MKLSNNQNVSTSSSCKLSRHAGKKSAGNLLAEIALFLLNETEESERKAYCLGLESEPI